MSRSINLRDPNRCESLDVAVGDDGSFSRHEAVAHEPEATPERRFLEAVDGYSPEEIEFLRSVALASGHVATVRHFRRVADRLRGLRAGKVLKRVLDRVENRLGPAGVDRHDFIRTCLVLLQGTPGAEIEPLVNALADYGEAQETLGTITRNIDPALSVHLGLASGTVAAKRAGVSEGTLSESVARVRERLS